MSDADTPTSIPVATDSSKTGNAHSGETAPIGVPTVPSLERIVDVVLGGVSFVGEAAIRAAQSVTENPAAVIAVLEERGRPVRERIGDALRDAIPPLPSDVPIATAEVEEVKQLSTSETVPPAVMSDNLSDLERRARAMEQQITSSKQVDDVPVATSEETPAEEATFVPETPYTTLAESPYAISETEEEQTSEKKSFAEDSMKKKPSE